MSFTMANADKAYTAMAVISVTVTAASGVWRSWRPCAVALFATPLGFVVGILAALSVAGLMIGLHREMTW